MDTQSDEATNVLNEGLYATATYFGDYNQSQRCFEALLQDMATQNLTKIGKAMEVYRIDIHTTKDINEYVTEIQIPVTGIN